MTPRMFGLLYDRHREELAHREMVAAYTTAAAINHSMNPPKEWVSPLEYMPSYRASKRQRPTPTLTDEELEQQSAYDLRVAELAAKLKAKHG